MAGALAREFVSLSIEWCTLLCVVICEDSLGGQRVADCVIMCEM